MLTNVRGAEAELLELFEALPQSDYRRRALMVATLANVAADRADPALRRLPGRRLRGQEGGLRGLLSSPSGSRQLRRRIAAA
jgi:hypothetical protein